MFDQSTEQFSFHNHVTSHLNFDTTFRISRPFSVNGLNVKHQLSPELNKNFAICNIYPNREPKDFSEKKTRPIVNNLAAIKCSSPFNYNVIDEENDQNPKGRQKFQPCFQTTK